MADKSSPDRLDNYLRKELVQRLTQDPELLTFITNECLDGVFFWDLEAPENEYMSDRFWEVLGHDPANRAHKTSEWQDLIHPDDLKTAMRNFEAHCQDPSHPYDQIVRYRSEAGRWVHVRCRGVALRDETGRPVRLFGTHMEVGRLVRATRALHQKQTELSAALEELTQSEKELQFLFDAIPLKIWYKDDKNRILRANRTAAESVGATPEALRNADTYELYPEVAAKYHADDLAVIESQEARRGIIEPYAPKDGEQGWVSTDKIPIRTADGSRALLVVSKDISELKRNEEKLSALTEASRQFAAIAAHDLRSPLIQSSTMMDIVASELKDAGFSFSEDGKFAFDNVIENLVRMRTMIDDLHMLSRLETERVEAHPVDLKFAVDRVRSDCMDMLDTAGADLVLENSLPFRGSQRLVEQALTNLVRNACKFHDEHDLTISIGMTSDASTQQVIISVADTGPGIPPSQAEKIFRPFVRLENAIDKEGTGLGLAIVSRIMTAHGGSVSLDPSYRDGARFLLAFPRS